MIDSVDIIHSYDAMCTRSLHTFTGQRIADVTMTFTVSGASGAGSFLLLRFLRCHISLCFSISHRRHVPSGGGRRTAATATDTWIWRFCGEKMKSLCACRACSLSLAHHRQKMWRDSKKGKHACFRTTTFTCGPFPFHPFQDLYLNSESREGFESADSMVISALRSSSGA